MSLLKLILKWYNAKLENFPPIRREVDGEGDQQSENPSVKPFILSSIGYAYQAKKDYKAAANHFEKIVSDPNGYMKDEALFNLGEIYAKLGNTEKSREAFKKILSDYTDSIYIDVVKERIAG